MDCWTLLGIEETADKRKIKSAYAKLLKQNHPEDSPKEYQSIREAYDYALMIAEYMNHEEDQDAELSYISALAPQPSEQVQPVAEQSLPTLREKDRVRGIQLETIDSALAKLVPLLQRDDELAIVFCRTTLSEDFFQALDVRYEFEGRLLVTLLQNDLLPFAFLEYLEQEFQWDIDLDRPGRMDIGHFDNDLRFCDTFYAVADRYLAQLVRNELRVHLQSTHSWLAVEQFDQIDALLFTPGHESELTEFCKAKHNRELIESAIAFLTKHHYIANHSSLVPRKTLQWLVSEQIVQAVDLKQPEPNQPQFTEHKAFYFPYITLLFFVYLLIRFVISVGQDSSSNSNFSRPTSSRSGSSEYFDGYAASRATFKLYRKAAELGVASAQYNLARMYRHGRGVPQDYAGAAKWYRKAAEQGHSKAQYSLALMYRYGKFVGVPQDYAEAVKWYRKAADQGDAEAQFMLAHMYGNGEGVPLSYIESYVWNSIAAASGHEDSIYDRDLIAKKLSTADLGAAQKRAAKLLEEIQQMK
jgi:hypothetical protein